MLALEDAELPVGELPDADRLADADLGDGLEQFGARLGVVGADVGRVVDELVRVDLGDGLVQFGARLGVVGADVGWVVDGLVRVDLGEVADRGRVGRLDGRGRAVASDDL